MRTISSGLAIIQRRASGLYFPWSAGDGALFRPLLTGPLGRVASRSSLQQQAAAKITTKAPSQLLVRSMVKFA